MGRRVREESSIDLDCVYAEARARKNVGSWADLARLLSQRPQTIQHWKDRGVPMNKLLFIQERIGCPMESILKKGLESALSGIDGVEEENLTAEEKALVAYFRRADQGTRDALFKLIPGLRELLPHEPASKNVVHLRHKKRPHSGQ